LNRPLIPTPRRGPAAAGPGRGGPGRGSPQGGAARSQRRTQFLKDEGVAAVLNPGQRGEWGVIVAQAGGSRNIKDPLPLPTVAIFAEQYNRIARLLAQNVTVRLEMEVETKFHDENLDSLNVIAEIPGGAKRDELVMIGAHLDSWTGGTGAADNAAGCAVMMEVMRVLKALNLRMDRTVRLALWSGEEAGLLGSRAYVGEHFGDRRTMNLKPEHGKLSVYLNFDNGSGKIRGVYLQNNDMARPIFEAWLAPFRDMDATALPIRGTSGTDHLSFDDVGLPGFQFVQDPLEYNTRTHHTNLDNYERVQPSDLMQASAIITSFVYNAATRPEMMPRKPLPKPSGGGRGGQ
jgi:carboxypeptidase Q